MVKEQTAYHLVDQLYNKHPPPPPRKIMDDVHKGRQGFWKPAILIYISRLLVSSDILGYLLG